MNQRATWFLLVSLSLLYVYQVFDGNKQIEMLENELQRTRNGLIANDKKLNDDIKQLREVFKSEMERTNATISPIKKKTEAFCVYTKTGNLYFRLPGECPP